MTFSLRSFYKFSSDKFPTTPIVIKMIKTLALVAVGVASASALVAPSALPSALPMPACRPTGVTMQMEESTSRRAALGAIFAGALAVPAAANAAYGTAKGQKDANWQLRNGGVMTDVESSSMSGVRASGAGSAGIDAKKYAAKFDRSGLTDQDINTVENLTNRIMEQGPLSKYKTSNKIGINPGYGGSSGIFTGAK